MEIICLAEQHFSLSLMILECGGQEMYSPSPSTRAILSHASLGPFPSTFIGYRSETLCWYKARGENQGGV